MARIRELALRSARTCSTLVWEFPTRSRNVQLVTEPDAVPAITPTAVMVRLDHISSDISNHHSNKSNSAKCVRFRRIPVPIIIAVTSRSSHERGNALSTHSGSDIDAGRFAE